MATLWSNCYRNWRLHNVPNGRISLTALSSREGTRRDTVPQSLFDARNREKETAETKKLSPRLALPGSAGWYVSRMKQK
jgi:hypothetical protein